MGADVSQFEAEHDWAAVVGQVQVRNRELVVGS
jgi:hypothetical protein